MIRLRRATLLAVLAPARLAAQRVTVEVVAETTARPVAGALISLEAPGDRIVARLLADQAGRATIGGPSGRYRLKVDGIGYQGVRTDWFDLVDGAVTRTRVALTPRPLDLGELVVTSRRKPQCRLDQEEGTFVARVWAEARKVLLATQITAAHRPLLDVTTYERTLDAAGRIHAERADTVRTSSARPFASIDPETLHREGFVFQRPDGLWYNAPDADLLLSEQFLDDHCFGAVGPGAGDPPGSVGLSFEPIRSRHLPDVHGVLWIDGKSAELRHLEFGYRNLDLPAHAEAIGGRIEFDRLPDGGWIVGRWQLRMPRVGRIMLGTAPDGGGLRQRDSLLGYKEAGGTARLAGDAPADARAIRVAGVVTDSTTGTPLSGIHVSLQAGAFSDTTDSTGRYRITAAAVGHYAITFAHPILALAGRDSIVRGAHLERGREDTVDLAIPLLAGSFRAGCPGIEPSADRGLVVGAVLDSVTRAPLAGAEIRIAAAVSRVIDRSVISERGAEYETRTDRNGYFRICGIPIGKDLGLTVGYPGHRTIRRTAVAPPSRVLRIDLMLPPS